MKKHIFKILKDGSGSKHFEKLLLNTQVALTKASGDPLKDENVKTAIQKLTDFFIDLKFALFFLRSDFQKSFYLPNQCVGFYAIPSDLINRKRSLKFEHFFKHLFNLHYDPEGMNILKNLSDIEIARMDEALVTLQVGSYFSCIVMCVSAVESRLHNMAKKGRPRLYKQDKLAKRSLGVLLSEIYTNKKYKVIRETLPERYFHLFNVCNEYRIFSAHPKAISINYQDAISIFSLSMAILVAQNNTED